MTDSDACLGNYAQGSTGYFRRMPIAHAYPNTISDYWGIIEGIENNNDFDGNKN